MNDIQAATTLLYGPYKRRLAACPQAFIEWLLSSCTGPRSIKACNFLISTGPFSGRRINSLSADQLHSFTLDEDQNYWAHSIANDKLDEALDRELAEERAAAISAKYSSPEIPPTAKQPPKNPHTSFDLDGERVQLYYLSLSDLRTLRSEVDGWKRDAICTAIKWKELLGEHWKPDKAIAENERREKKAQKV